MKNYLSYLVALILLIIAYSCDKEVAGIENNDNLSASSKGLVTLKSGVVVEKKGNDYIWEGDIVLSPIQLKNLDESGRLILEKPKYIGANTSVHPVYNISMTAGAGNTAVPRAISISPTPYNLWAMVRFTYDSNLNAQQRNRIKSALKEIESSTNVRFYNATGKPTKHPVYGFNYPYVDFYYIGNHDTSNSRIGRTGGKQKINLASFAFGPFIGNQVIIHEIGHALGLKHEQTRLDRDKYVTINTSNLTPSRLAQFRIPTTNYYQTGIYSYNSVMGYPSKTRSTSVVYDTNLPMYTKIGGGLIEQGSTFSSSDRNWVNRFYIPYIARSDTYSELAPVVYKPDNTVMTASERLALQKRLNNGNPTPPNCCRIPNNF
ncbi:MAG: M12 family metallopeptidase [Polaribacter sp.]